MIKASLRGLRAHRLRLVLTSLAIALSVAFVAGTYVFTDSLQKALNDLTSSRIPDVLVTPKQPFDTPFLDDARPRTLPQRDAARARSVTGVSRVEQFVSVRNVEVIGSDGEPIGRSGDPGSSGLGQSWIADESLAPAILTSGRAPTGQDEVLVDTSTAKKLNASVGDPVQVLLPNGTSVRPRIVGFASRGASAQGGSGSIVIWDRARAQQLLLEGKDESTSLRIALDPAASPESVAQALKAELPSGTNIRTAEQVADDTAQRLKDRLGFLNAFLLAFAMIALFVSAFLIYNTFSILIAQRTRELALFRAIGATGGQVTRAVLLESTVIALFASTLGLLMGLGVAQGLKGLFAAFGSALPIASLVVAPRTIALAYGIGFVVTLVSAWYPARRAAKVAPIAALRESESTHQSLARRTWVGLACALVSALIAAWGLSVREEASAASLRIGLAAAVGMVAIIILAPLATVGITSGIKSLVTRSVTGRLAMENTKRNPRRTAATSGALMIGLALISALSVLTSSIISSTDAVVDKVFGTDFVLIGKTFRPFPTDVYKSVKDLPEVSTAAFTRQAPVRIGTDDGLATGIQPQSVNAIVDLEVVEGSISDVKGDKVAVDRDLAVNSGYGVGSLLNVLSLDGQRQVEVSAVFNPIGPYRGVLTSMEEIARLGAPDLDSAVYVKLTPGVDPQEARRAVENAIADYPTVVVQDQTEFKQSIQDQIRQLLVFILLLLVLSVLIAFLGIINTLALSVFERTREFGLLRAVGATRAQVQRVVVAESLAIALIGAALGTAFGLVFGTLMQRVLAAQGIDRLAYDVPQLLLFVALALVGGLIAAWWPSRRAARLDVLKAISVE